MIATLGKPFPEFHGENVHVPCFLRKQYEHKTSTRWDRTTNTIGTMDSKTPKNPLSVQIGRRMAQLREEKKLTLEELARATGDLLSKSRLSNYEQGLRRLPIEEASILARPLGCTAAYLLCLDDDNSSITKDERTLIDNLRSLPPQEQAAYRRRIATLALAYREPVPDEKIIKTGFASASNRKAKVSKRE